MITISITTGELLDRVSILYIKNSKFKGEKRKETLKELKRLLPIVSPLLENSNIDDLYTDLMGINFEIWELKDKLKDIKAKSSIAEISRLILAYKERKLLIEQVNIQTS